MRSNQLEKIKALESNVNKIRRNSTRVILATMTLTTMSLATIFFVGPFNMKKTRARDAEVERVTNEHWKNYRESTSDLLSLNPSVEIANKLSDKRHAETKENVDKDTRAILADPRFAGRGMGRAGSIATLLGFLALGGAAGGILLASAHGKKEKEYLEQLRKIKVSKGTYKYLTNRYEVLGENQQKDIVEFLCANVTKDELTNIIKTNSFIAQEIELKARVDKVSRYDKKQPKVF
ncbi:MAG: hypothetical protein FWE47_01555 [Oscillospiraceae bacterium]|nr:hypothetical protein [Oscillospiraceae bacterium]